MPTLTLQELVDSLTSKFFGGTRDRSSKPRGKLLSKIEVGLGALDDLTTRCEWNHVFFELGRAAAGAAAEREILLCNDLGTIAQRSRDRIVFWVEFRDLPMHKPKPEAKPEAKPERPASPDVLLRRAGFRIHSRPRTGPTMWERRGLVMPQAAALGVAERELSQ